MFFDLSAYTRPLLHVSLTVYIFLLEMKSFENEFPNHVFFFQTNQHLELFTSLCNSHGRLFKFLFF